MRDSLRAETAKLERSWMRHDSDKLRHYLVAGVEDPRINAQSILSRHFLLQASCGENLQKLMDQEHRFGAVMNWLLKLLRYSSETEELAAVLYALRRGADNAEGIEIPLCILQSFASLPVVACGFHVPNYIESLLEHSTLVSGKLQVHPASLDTFQGLWNAALEQHLAAAKPVASSPARPTVLEPACGSANDYRFLDAYGLTRVLHYSGMDLCEKNVLNARALFPGAHFACGNAFALPFPDKSFDLCFVHDLFEHLSPEGMEQAIVEICRVAREGICVGFFNMHEIPEHKVVPDEDYYWNDLSLVRTRESFAQLGFRGQVIHVGTFLRDRVGCVETHNPNAYTFYLRANVVA
jgi:ubiquinone/menaquinone biosynthesis C-methylase UbiE